MIIRASEVHDVASRAAGQAEPGRRVTTALGIASLACALVQLPLELRSLGLLWLLSPGAVFHPAAFLQVGLPVLAITFGGLGLARIKSAGGRARRPALAGLWLGVFEVCLFTLATVAMLTHGDRIA
jgi:hypothetical protein